MTDQESIHFKLSSSEKDLLHTAYDALRARHTEARGEADKTARRLGYAVASNPQGDHVNLVESLRIQDAVACAILEDVQLVGGYVSSLLVNRPTETPQDSREA